MSRRRYRSRLLTWIVNAGPSDTVLNLYLVLGPLLIVLVTVVGRTAATTIIVAGYVVGFVGYTIYNALTTTGRPDWIRHP
ncbi:hypothetical protein [Natrinema altunense]|uniref:Uncharacterized protein n=1 Tax=Natrinema altunense TaxID=222984 RepID=A0A482Y312_9EURY|nr:hypothetical protein [Natrinema altunense]RZH68704.1 hypothetical protein ELS17_04350 [Natrinema altunense]